MQFTILHLKENRLHWEKIYLEELEARAPSNSEEERTKSKKRLESFLQKYKEVLEPPHLT